MGGSTILLCIHREHEKPRFAFTPGKERKKERKSSIALTIYDGSGFREDHAKRVSQPSSILLEVVAFVRIFIRKTCRYQVLLSCRSHRGYDLDAFDQDRRRYVPDVWSWETSEKKATTNERRTPSCSRRHAGKTPPVSPASWRQVWCSQNNAPRTWRAAAEASRSSAGGTGPSSEPP